MFPVHNTKSYGALIRAFLDGNVVFSEREESEECPNCGGGHPSYGYTKDLFPDSPLAPGESFDRKFCVCGYAESPLSEDRRVEWREGL